MVNRMDDLISRQALMKEFSDFVRESNNSDFAPTPTWNDAVSLVGSMPSADRRGRWVKGDEMADYPRVPYNPWETYCSCCGEIMEQSHDNFCGNCGAKMDEVEDNG